MKFIMSSFTESLSIFRKDKLILLFSLVPIIIGIVLYYFLGQLIFTDFQNWIDGWVNSHVSSGGLGKAIGWIVTATLSIIMYFVVQWTFVLLVSLIASPFNDIISNRTEKILKGETPESLDKSIGRIFKRLSFTLLNEIKKISFIAIMTVVAVVLNFIPILVPISFILSAILFAIGFVDYSWSRNNVEFKSCVVNVKERFLGYTISGSIFMLIVAIPVVNLIALPYAVIYYTVYYTKNKMITNE